MATARWIAASATAGPFRAGRQALFAPALVGLSLYALTFANVAGVGNGVQLLAIGLNGVAALAGLGKAGRGRGLSCYELALIAICVASFVAVTIAQFEDPNDFTDYSLRYTVLASVAVLSAMVNARAMLPATFLSVAALASLASTLTICAIYPLDVVTSLTAGAADRWALRFSPFNMHPNLGGLVFGGHALFACYLYSSTRRYLPLFALFGVLDLGLVLATGSRAGLLALVLVAAGTLAMTYRSLDARAKHYLWLGLLLGGAVLICFGGSLGNHLNRLLELDSTTRGFESGGSGRIDLWRQGIELIGSSWRLMLLGGGLRWSVDDNIGFLTENSYITIVLDSGLVAGGVLIMAMVHAVYRAGGALRISPYDREAVALFMIGAYGLIESLFNRYLFAIGNPFSLSALYIFLYASAGMFGRGRV